MVKYFLNENIRKNSLCFCAVYSSNIIMIMMSNDEQCHTSAEHYLVNSRYVFALNEYRQEHGLQGEKDNMEIL
jgi:hypothetical protein